MPATPGTRLVFTDMDGSLLDHYSYSFRPALPALRQLERLGVPVIPATSKTRAELAPLREALDSHAPFITENGAAVYIPVGALPAQPADTLERDGFWVREFAGPRRQWLDLLQDQAAEYGTEYSTFFKAGLDGIVAMTGLSRDAAALANDREYSEPVRWRGDAQRLEAFLAALTEGGATVQRGGRFLSVGGDCSKGEALAWLRSEYAAQLHIDKVNDLAIGDSDNDRSMLEAAGTALLIRSPEHDFPQLQRTEGLIYSHGLGPEGWAEGVLRWLREDIASKKD